MHCSTIIMKRDVTCVWAKISTCIELCRVEEHVFWYWNYEIDENDGDLTSSFLQVATKDRKRVFGNFNFDFHRRL